MRSLKTAELRKRLSAYLNIVKAGEEVIVCERNRLVPFSSHDATEKELDLVAAGLMRLPEAPFDFDAFDKLPLAKVTDRRAIEVLPEERNEGR